MIQIDDFPMSVVVVDAEWRVVEVNRTASERLKTATQNSPGLLIDAFFEGGEAIRRRFESGLVPSGRHVVRGVRLARADRRGVVDVVAERRPGGALLVLIDVDERVALEAELARLQKALADSEQARRKMGLLQTELTGAAQAPAIIGSSLAIRRMLDQAERVAPSPATVLIHGESGSGKELVARTIHAKSPRARRPMVAVNCASLPETLIESELFGHEKGSFTGATSMKRGQFEQADGGTLFLDEIGDMSLNTQAKVLRALQEQQFTRVGGAKLMKVDVRVLAASNKDLEKEIAKGHFREDLFYRLNVVPIIVPPLRERREDIPALVRHFMKVHAEEQGLRMKEVTPDAMAVFQQYEWPGNIRELRNLIERLMIMVPGGVIDAPQATMSLQGRAGSQSAPAAPQAVNPLLTKSYDSLRDARNAFEKDYIGRKLREHHWNISRTAEDLKIERSHLHRKIKLLEVEMRPEG